MIDLFTVVVVIFINISSSSTKNERFERLIMNYSYTVLGESRLHV